MAVSPSGSLQFAFLDHVYAVVDRDLADAVEASPYLKEFAPLRVDTVVANDGDSWTGRYVLGVSTYVELFGPGDVEGGVPGDTGFGLSPREVGGLELILGTMAAAGDPEPLRRSRTRRVDDIDIPWFDLIVPPGDEERLSVWVMEYVDPQALGRRRQPDDIRPLMRDVSGFELSATVHDLDRITPLLRGSGFTIERSPDTLTARDLDTTITLTAADVSRPGLRRIDFRLHEATDRHVEEVGRSTLVVGPGPEARWTFPTP